MHLGPDFCLVPVAGPLCVQMSPWGPKLTHGFNVLRDMKKKTSVGQKKKDTFFKKDVSSWTAIGQAAFRI